MDDVRDALRADLPRAGGLDRAGGVGDGHGRDGNVPSRTSSSRARAWSSSTNGYFGERLAEIGQRLWRRRCIAWPANGGGRSIPRPSRRPSRRTRASARRGRPRRDVDRRRQSGRADCRRRARARMRCAGGRGDVARRHAGGRGRVGDRRVLQRQSEVPGCAERHRTARVHAACVGAACLVPQLLFRSRVCSTPTGGSASTTTRSRRRWSMRLAEALAESRGRRSRTAVGASSAPSRVVCLRSGRSRPHAVAAGARAAVDAAHGRRSSRGRRSGGQDEICASSTTSRSAREWVRWRDACGASASWARARRRRRLRRSPALWQR